MKRISRNHVLLMTLFLLLPWLSACSDKPAEVTDSIEAGRSQETASADSEAEPEPPDVVARVGDQTITFNTLNTMINSSPIIGLSIPELGSP